MPSTSWQFAMLGGCHYVFMTNEWNTWDLIWTTNFARTGRKQRRPVILALTCAVSQSPRYFVSAQENSLTQSLPKQDALYGAPLGLAALSFPLTSAQSHAPVDPLVKLITGGAMPNMMTDAPQSKRISGKFVLDHHLFVSCAVVTHFERGSL